MAGPAGVGATALYCRYVCVCVCVCVCVSNILTF